MVTDLIFKFWIFSVKYDWSENYSDKKKKREWDYSDNFALWK